MYYELIQVVGDNKVNQLTTMAPSSPTTATSEKHDMTTRA